MKKDNRDNYQISLKVILKNAQGKLLLLKPDPNGTLRGFYDLPGGRLDKNEFRTPFEKIIRREIREEVGNISYKMSNHHVAVSRGKFFSQTSKKEIRILYIFFEARYLGGRIKVSSEHIGYDWIKVTQKNVKKLFTSGMLEGMKMYLAK